MATSSLINPKDLSQLFWKLQRIEAGKKLKLKYYQQLPIINAKGCQYRDLTLSAYEQGCM
jgi:hypothetical protein